MTQGKESFAQKRPAGDNVLTPSFYRTEKRLATLLRDIDHPHPGGGDHHDYVKASPGLDKGNPLRAYILADAAGLGLGFLCAWLLAATINTLFFNRHGLSEASHEIIMPIAQFTVIGCGLMVWLARMRHYQVRLPFWMEAKKIVEVAGFALLVSCFVEFVAKQSGSRLWLMSGWVFGAAGIIAARVFCRSILRERGAWTLRSLVIGDGPTADEAYTMVDVEPGMGYKIVGQITDLLPAFEAAGHSWRTLCQAHGADYVFIALDGDDFIHAQPCLAQLMREHVPFSVASPMRNLSVFSMAPHCFLGHDVMFFTRHGGLDYSMPRFLKRSFDIAVSLSALIVLGPAMLALAALVRLDGGKAFFSHMRVGLNGEVFPCLKFRSMAEDSDRVLAQHLDANPLARAEWRRDHKLRTDPRVTAIGNFLRRTSLDELPQLFNVLKGDMSIVGPRPIIADEMSRYERDIAFYHRVRPGMTGLWQVSGRNDVSYAERVRMDSWYVRNWSLWNDITIICKTFAVVLKQDGAY